MKVSISKENHLKAIFHLQQEQGLVTTNALAAALNTRPASVTDMLKKLKEQKLLNYERYKGFKLTGKAEGRRPNHPQTPALGIFPRQEIAVSLG